MEIAKVRLQVDSDGVALITMNNPPVNSLSSQVLDELLKVFAEAHSRSDVKAIVLTGANGKFSGGADIKSMSNSSERKMNSTEETGLRLMNEVIEGGPKPVVAAITGFALGGGLELAMACHCRIASPGTRLGLPELQLGIIPGLGGTQRLPRLVGVKKALDMMLKAKMITTEDAKASGLVDNVCESSKLLEVARAYALGIANRHHPLVKSLDRTDKIQPMAQTLAAIYQARKLAKTTYSRHVEYPFICIDVVEHGVRNGGLEGTILERKMGIKTVASHVGKSLMHLFIAERAVYKVPGVPQQMKARAIRSVGIVGGGLMGSGIATSFILHKIPVYLKEVDQDRLQASIERVKSNLSSRISKGTMTTHESEKTMALLTGTIDYSSFASVDLVIEAVVESVPLKAQIFRDLDRFCSPDCILASNTSSCDLTVITKGVSNPGRVIGAHFFSPAHVMRLVEIVTTEKTSISRVVDLLALSKKISKVPVVVKNTVGFAVNRIFFPYPRMSAFLVDLGLHPYRIDTVMKDFGMPMGPFRLGDLTGLQLGSYVTELFKEEFGDRVYSSALGSLLVQNNRLGESTGKGYYNYVGTRKAQPAPELDDYLELSRSAASLPRGLAEFIADDNEIVEMILFPVVNEACRVLDEGIVARSSDLDVASVLGMGFPAFRGGIMFWAENVGLGYILSKLNRWHEVYGPYFRPTSSLHKFVAMKSSTPKSRL